MTTLSKLIWPLEILGWSLGLWLRDWFNIHLLLPTTRLVFFNRLLLTRKIGFCSNVNFHSIILFLLGLILFFAFDHFGFFHIIVLEINGVHVLLMDSILILLVEQ